jgi:hypothetical protein
MNKCKLNDGTAVFYKCLKSVDRSGFKLLTVPKDTNIYRSDLRTKDIWYLSPQPYIKPVWFANYNVANSYTTSKKKDMLKKRIHAVMKLEKTVANIRTLSLLRGNLKKVDQVMYAFKFKKETYLIDLLDKDNLNKIFEILNERLSLLRSSQDKISVTQRDKTNIPKDIHSVKMLIFYFKLATGYKISWEKQRRFLFKKFSKSSRLKKDQIKGSKPHMYKNYIEKDYINRISVKFTDRKIAEYLCKLGEKYNFQGYIADQSLSKYHSQGIFAEEIMLCKPYEILERDRDNIHDYRHGKQLSS